MRWGHDCRLEGTAPLESEGVDGLHGAMEGQIVEAADQHDLARVGVARIEAEVFEQHVARLAPWAFVLGVSHERVEIDLLPRGVNVDLDLDGSDVDDASVVQVVEPLVVRNVFTFGVMLWTAPPTLSRSCYSGHPDLMGESSVSNSRGFHIYPPYIRT